MENLRFYVRIVFQMRLKRVIKKIIFTLLFLVMFIVFGLCINVKSTQHDIRLQVKEIRIVTPIVHETYNFVKVGLTCNVISTLYVRADRQTEFKIVDRTGWIKLQAGEKVAVFENIKEVDSVLCQVTEPCRLWFTLE